MPRTAFCAAFLIVAATTLSGCLSGAKVINQQRDPTTGRVVGGVVSIPENTNVWPTYYQNAAYAKIREAYPAFDSRDIVKAEDVVVGQQTRNDQLVDRRPIGPDGKPVGELIRNTNTTTTTDLKEFHITYQVKPTFAGNNGGVVQTGGLAKPYDSLPPRSQLNGNAPRTGLNSQPSSMNLDPVPSLSNSTFGNR